MTLKEGNTPQNASRSAVDVRWSVVNLWRENLANVARYLLVVKMLDISSRSRDSAVKASHRHDHRWTGVHYHESPLAWQESAIPPRDSRAQLQLITTVTVITTTCRLQLCAHGTIHVVLEVDATAYLQSAVGSRALALVPALALR